MRGPRYQSGRQEGHAVPDLDERVARPVTHADPLPRRAGEDRVASGPAQDPVAVAIERGGCAGHSRGPEGHVEPGVGPARRDHVRVQLRPAGLGIVEVAPRHEVDAPEAGPGRNGGRGRSGSEGLSGARDPRAGREGGRPRVVTHPGQVSPAGSLESRTLWTSAKPATITASTTACTPRSTTAVARGAPCTAKTATVSASGARPPARPRPTAARPPTGTWSARRRR